MGIDHDAPPPTNDVDDDGEFDFSYYNLNAFGFLKLLDILITHPKIVSLNLSNNQLDDESVVQLTY